MVEAVNLGVKTARDLVPAATASPWSRAGASYGETEAPRPRTKLRFTEEMKGYAALGIDATRPTESRRAGRRSESSPSV